MLVPFEIAEPAARQPRQPAEGPSRRIGRVVGVVDSLLGSPILAVIARPDREGVEVSSQPDGGLLITANERVWSQGFVLDLRSSGYRGARARISLDVERIELDPSALSDFVVRHSGAIVPIGGARLHWMDEGRLRPVGATVAIDEAGRARLEHARPLMVELLGEDGRSLFVGEVQPGSSLVVRLDGPSRSLVFTDLEGQGVPALPILVGTWSGATTRSMTDPEGRIPLSGPEWSRVEVRLDTNRYRFCPIENQQVGLTLENRSMRIPPARLVAGGELTLRVEATVRRIQVVDRSTGAPVDRARGYLTTRIVPDHREAIEGLILQGEVSDGWFDIPYGFGSVEKAPAGTSAVLYVAGFAPHAFPPLEYPFLREGPKESRVAVDPVSDGRELRILDSGAPMDAGVVLIESILDDQVLFVGQPTKSLRYGPFDCHSTRVAVRSTTMGPLGEASVLGSEQVYVLELGATFGSIEVVGGDTELPLLIAMSQRFGIVRPESNDGSSCTFLRLLPGSYLVGPEEWVSQIVGVAGYEEYWTSVKAGASVLVQAQVDWASGSASEGRLQWSPGAPAPVLLPQYWVPVPKLSNARITALEVDPSGMYRLPEEGPAVKAIVAADDHGGVWRIRGVFEPAGFAMLEEVELRLLPPRDEANTGPFDVAYHGDWPPALVLEGLQPVELRIHPGTEPASVWVPRGTRELGVRRSRDGATRILTGPLIGTTEVDLDQLFRP